MCNIRKPGYSIKEDRTLPQALSLQKKLIWTGDLRTLTNLLGEYKILNFIKIDQLEIQLYSFWSSNGKK